MVITHQNNVVESRGYFLHREALDHLEPDQVALRKHILQLEELEDEDRMPKEVQAFMEEKQDMLKQPFNFYTFAAEINGENRLDVAGRTYNRLLHKEIADYHGRLEAIKAELYPARRMTKAFKENESESFKKMTELQAKYEMEKDDRRADKVAMDKRFNMLIRDFVAVYKKLASEFLHYKDYLGAEHELQVVIIKKKDELLEFKDKQVKDYELALKIPRQHFKHIEKLKYEEMLEQRDAIIAKFKKKGIDLTQKGALLDMPDPSLDPAKQLEMLAGGATVPALEAPVPGGA